MVLLWLNLLFKIDNHLKVVSSFRKLFTNCLGQENSNNFLHEIKNEV